MHSLEGNSDHQGLVFGTSWRDYQALHSLLWQVASPLGQAPHLPPHSDYTSNISQTELLIPAYIPLNNNKNCCFSTVPIPHPSFPFFLLSPFPPPFQGTLARVCFSCQGPLDEILYGKVGVGKVMRKLSSKLLLFRLPHLSLPTKSPLFCFNANEFRRGS